MRKVFCSSITLRKEKPSIANIILHYWCVWRKKSQKNGHKWKRKKCSFTKTMHRVTSRSQRWKKLHELLFELLPHSPYSTDLTPSDYWLLADLEGMLQGKKFGSNEEVISETETHFESKGKSFYQKSIEWLEKRWNQCISLEGDYVDK